MLKIVSLMVSNNRFVKGVEKHSQMLLFYLGTIAKKYHMAKLLESIQISVPTSVLWQHKILDVIKVYIGIGDVSGIVETDEIFSNYPIKAIILFQKR